MSVNNSFIKNTAKNFKNITKKIVNELTITIYSRRQVIINNYGKILKFDDDFLMVGTKFNILQVTGVNLILSEMATDYLIVEGDINLVEFIK